MKIKTISPQRHRAQPGKSTVKDFARIDFAGGALLFGIFLCSRVSVVEVL